MEMLKFTLQSFRFSLTLNQFHIQTPLQLNQLMIMIWIISWNYSIHNTMEIFWMFTSRCFKLDWWSPLLQKFIQYLLCCFIKTEERMFQSQIACHTFLCLYQPRSLWNWLTETWDMPNELGLFMSLYKLFYYISSRTSLILSRSPFQHYIIRWPQVLSGFKKVTSETIGHCDFVGPQGRSWRSPYQTHNNIEYLQLEIVNINPHIDKNIVVPTVIGL